MYDKVKFKAIEKAEILLLIEGGAELWNGSRQAGIVKAIYKSTPEFVRIKWGYDTFEATPTKKGLEWARRMVE